MPIYEILTKDHREVENLFEEIQDSLDDQDFREVEGLFEQLKTELISHAKAEQEVFYEPLIVATQADEGEELIWEGEEEHHVMALLLSELSRLDCREDAWKVKLSVLSKIFEDHVEEEEEEMFTVAKGVFDAESAELMGQNMLKLKEHYKGMVDEALSEDIELLLQPLYQSSGSYPDEDTPSHYNLY